MVTVLPVKAGALRVSCLGLCGPEAEKVLGAGPGFNFRPSLTAPPHDKPYPALPPAPKEAPEAGDAVCKDVSLQDTVHTQTKAQASVAQASKK